MHRAVSYQPPYNLDFTVHQGSGILVADGIATGASMMATIRALKASGIRKIILAVLIAPAESIEKLSRLVDELVVLYAPSPFIGIKAYYSDFRELYDEEIREYLEKARATDKIHLYSL